MQPLGVQLSRRRLLWLATIGAASVPTFGLLDAEPVSASTAIPAGPGGLTSDPVTMTMESFADTLIPGHKRSADDYAIAGVAAGPGAVQAGALEFMNFGPVGVAPAVPAFAAAVDALAAAYIAAHVKVVDVTLPPFVALRYRDRKAVLDSVLNHGNGEEQLLWFAFAGLVCLAYYTAGYLPTATAVRAGHPGLKAIGFPMPDHDGLWRFPHFSYRRKLAHEHPHTTRTGSPR
jgi:enediyne biosynthesis protein E8